MISAQLLCVSMQRLLYIVAVPSWEYKKEVLLSAVNAEKLQVKSSNAAATLSLVYSSTFTGWYPNTVETLYLTLYRSVLG